MKINSKFVRFDSNYVVESNFSDAEFVRNSFDSIQKSMIRNVENNSKNSIKINSKFVRIDSTTTIFGAAHFNDFLTVLLNKVF